MIILDEDIDFIQQERLRAWKIHCWKIGRDIGHQGMKDKNEIIPLFHPRRGPTFFSRDHGYYNPKLRHAGYCLVYLDVLPEEAADYIRRFLRHRSFRMKVQRTGKVIRLRHRGVTYWQMNDPAEHVIAW